MGNKNAKNDKDNLKNITGHKFKSMWSSKTMYFFFVIELYCFVMAKMSCMVSKSETIRYGDINELLIFNIVIVIIFLLLILINMKFLGRVVAVVNDKGIHSNAGFIPWKNIKAVRYHSRLIGKHMTSRDSYCSLSIFTANKEYEITHAPRILLWCIKIKKPAVKIKCDYGLLIIFIFPFISGICIGLLHK